MSTPLTAVVFDLDDTLFRERQFLHSAYRQLAVKYGKIYGLDPDSLFLMMLKADNAFDSLVDRLMAADISLVPPTAIEMRDFYRSHYPDISLDIPTEYLLATLASRSDIILGLITDGRSVTQRRKIEALRLDRFIAPDHILISGEIGSEKISGVPFEIMEKRVPADRYFYIGDNPLKDIEPARERGWKTIILRDTDSLNIHPQPPYPAPHFIVDSLSELLTII